jgi:NAD(P)-dependent dehydrogenase (short-subunit alcohol dehydrogenase family)
MTDDNIPSQTIQPTVQPWRTADLPHILTPSHPEIAMTVWTTKAIPPQDGKTALVTGATSGIGLKTALALAGAGAKVIIASRNQPKGAEALARIRAAHPAADVRFEPLDLASLASIADCADRLGRTVPQLDLLINNAGVMAIPTRHLTADGFEMQLGANHLGHFALTLRLLPLVLAAPAPRVVTLSSLAHRSGRIAFDDLQSERRYKPWQAYNQAKLANLMFSLELDRRARAEGWVLQSIAAHPGIAATGLQAAGPGMGRAAPRLLERVMGLLIPILGQSAAAGALPTLYAATMPAAEGGVLYGPDGFSEIKGSPSRSKIAPQALDQAVWRRLWDVSEALTHVTIAGRAAA